jgi:predicted nuclease of predicted toxin-antitoxin system
VSVRIKVDEDLPSQIAEIFAGYGHYASTVVEQGWTGLDDSELWMRVQRERRWMVTADKVFGNLRVYPPGKHAGVVLLRVDRESRRAYVALAQNAVQRLDLDSLAGSMIVVAPRGIRIRKPV